MRIAVLSDKRETGVENVVRNKAMSHTDVIVNQHIVGTGVFPFTLEIPIPSEVKAIFAHNTIALGEDTDLTIGVRYNEFEQDAGNI